MRVKWNYAAVLLGILSVVLVSGDIGFTAHAGQDGLLIMGNPNAEETILFTYGEDGLVEGKREFVIPAAAGQNFDMEITFSGNGGDGILSFAYDNVTEDQMVPNVDKNADDRSGLLSEKVKEGEEQVRAFSVAATEGDIVITATGNGRVLSIRAVRQEAKSRGQKTCVYMIGDSLVQTYAEKYAPQTGWGQTLPLYYDDNVMFVNRALGGRSTGNYLRQGRLNEVLCEIAPGDCVLIEFGHNDATTGNSDRYVSEENFKKNLAEFYIKPIRDRGGIPVLVTLCNRNQYLSATGEFTVSFPKYVEAMRETAAETNTLLIDLNAITVDYFTKLNQELGVGVTGGIIYNHAIAGTYEGEYQKGVKDNTHLQYYGAKLVGGFVAEELHRLNIAGISEYYVPLTVEKAPPRPEGIAEKEYEGYVSRIVWTPCEGADYYKVLVAEVAERVESDAQEGAGVIDGDGSGAGSENEPAVENSAGNVTYELAGEFEIAGYTAACDFAYSEVKREKRYAYKVIAVNAAGESPESEIFSFGLLQETENETGPAGADQDNEQLPDKVTVGIVSAAVTVLVLAVAALAIGVARKNRRDQ